MTESDAGFRDMILHSRSLYVSLECTCQLLIKYDK